MMRVLMAMAVIGLAQGYQQRQRELRPYSVCKFALPFWNYDRSDECPKGHVCSGYLIHKCRPDVCFQKDFCGGIGAIQCGKGFTCVTGALNECANNGGADCGGCCIEDHCANVNCGKGRVCEVNQKTGWPQCLKRVDPPQPGCKSDDDCDANEFCRAKRTPDGKSCAAGEEKECVAKVGLGERCNGFTLPCFYNQCHDWLACELSEPTGDVPGTCVAPKNCKTTCGEEVPHGWSGKDDGNNACNSCRCHNGVMACTLALCPEKKCPVRKPCLTPCNNLVPHGWNGKGDGFQHCNNCRCIDGAFACTRKLCEERTPECLSVGDICKQAGVEVPPPVDREKECPMGTSCIKNDGFAIGGEVPSTCKPGKCTTDDDCIEGHWCREEQNKDGTCSKDKVCVPYSFGGSPCGGDVSPCTLNKCELGNCAGAEPGKPGKCEFIACCLAAAVCPAGTKSVPRLACSPADFEDGTCQISAICCQTLTCRKVPF